MAVVKLGKISRLDEQIISFLNLVENFSKSDDDLVNILDRTSQYINEPLKSIINDFVMDARLYGKMDESFERLYKDIAGTRLVEVFKSLQICGKHDSNYADVVCDAKISIKEYLKSKSIQKAIINSARIDLCALLAGGVIVCNILNGFLTRSVMSILLSSYIGIGIIIYCVIVIGIAVYYLFWRFV